MTLILSTSMFDTENRPSRHSGIVYTSSARIKPPVILYKDPIDSYRLQIYDYVITFADELRLVWSSKLSVIKLLFLINRYLPFLTLALWTRGMTTSTVMKVET